MNKIIIITMIYSLGLINHLSAQFRISVTGGLFHSPEKLTNVATLPNIIFSPVNELRNFDIFESVNLRINAGLSYQFKNKLFVGLHFGKSSIDFSHSFSNLQKDFVSSFISGGFSTYHINSFIGKNFKFNRWKLLPYLGIGYQWGFKNSYSDYDKKITSTGFGSSSASNSDGTIFFSFSESNTDYVFPGFFIPVGLDINYYLMSNFSLLANLNYQYGFNKTFAKQEVMYQNNSLPGSSGFGIIERKNMFSINFGVGYTFENVESKSAKKTRKTLKTKQQGV